MAAEFPPIPANWPYEDTSQRVGQQVPRDTGFWGRVQEEGRVLITTLDEDQKKQQEMQHQIAAMESHAASLKEEIAVLKVVNSLDDYIPGTDHKKILDIVELAYNHDHSTTPALQKAFISSLKSHSVAKSNESGLLSTAYRAATGDTGIDDAINHANATAKNNKNGVQLQWVISSSTGLKLGGNLDRNAAKNPNYTKTADGVFERTGDLLKRFSTFGYNPHDLNTNPAEELHSVEKELHSTKQQLAELEVVYPALQKSATSAEASASSSAAHQGRRSPGLGR